MSDWTDGYVTDIGYTFGYYSELNPLRARLAFINAGLLPPELGTHCELGYGQGLSANIHAAASASTWYATDFNPAQAAFAQSLARASGAHAHLTDEAFADFCLRPDLPDFDSIGLHGIWSWISDENRAVIVDFVRRKLKVGGVLYVSYNTQPGWAAFVPVRDLLLEHKDVMGAAGHGVIANFDSALAFVEKLMATHPNYAQSNPIIQNRLSKLKEQNRHYLVGEYFNRNWLPMSFSAMADWLLPAKVDYVCSGNDLERINELNLTPEQMTFLQEIPDAMFRESVRDFIVNTPFRRDYWVKGARKLSGLEQLEAQRRHKILLTTPRSEVSLTVRGALGEANMDAAVYNPILDLLADHKAKTLAQIEQAVKDLGINFTQIMQAVVVLSGTGHLAALQDEAVVAKAKKFTDKLNAHLIDKARSSHEIKYLASPVTGGAINLARFPQLFLLALSQGKKQPAEWAQMVWQLLAAQNQAILKDGQPLATADENLAELTKQAHVFAEKMLPILKALQIA